MSVLFFLCNLLFSVTEYRRISSSFVSGIVKTGEIQIAYL